MDRNLAQLGSSGKSDVENAVRALRTQIPEDRRAEVTAALIPLLDHTDIFLARDVTETLATLQAPEAVPALLRVLGRTFVGDDAAKALIRFGPEIEPEVIKKLRDPNDTVRGNACEILAQIGTSVSLKTMRKLPADPNGLVQMKAADAMRQILARSGRSSSAAPGKPAGQ